MLTSAHCSQEYFESVPILQVALPSPLRRLFDYRSPVGVRAEDCGIGQRVRVPFGNRQMVGVIAGLSDTSELPAAKLKRALELIDLQPLLPESLWQLCTWTASYYQHGLGDTLSSALPVLLRQGEPALARQDRLWKLTTGTYPEHPAIARAPKQKEAVQILARHPHGLSHALIGQWGLTRDCLEALERKGLAERISQSHHHVDEPLPLLREAPLTANSEQSEALAEIVAKQGFATWLLEGVTGSGKTEVYLQAIEHALRQHKQALVLIPEIGLTPQTLERFRKRFSVPVVILHSGLNDRERLDAWIAARDGEAGVIIGTRSAIFTPLARPGLIIVDEEHDLSYKQQEGLRYNARDLAVYRGHLEQTGVLLGSATPSLESLHNVQRGRYQRLRLTQRAGNASPPRFECLDIRSRPLDGGLSRPLTGLIGEHLRAGNQVLVFINRRGFAPTLMCHDCGWIAECKRCDARMTVHQAPAHLHCHHCGSQRAVDRHCPKCNGEDLRPLGAGTERTEEQLVQSFPDVPVMRIDRDSMSRKQAMADMLRRIHSGGRCILVGTQMLAKGHHFPDVTLVAILDADGGLFSADFRGPERMAQQITQVAGRAGRADKPGQVLIQTHMAEHPLLIDLTEHGYPAIAERELAARQSANLPPYSFIALLRAEANAAALANQFLEEACSWAEQLCTDNTLQGIELLGPVPSPMERRAGRFRAQLLIQAGQRSVLHQLLHIWLPQLEVHPLARKVRWSLDVDPLDMF
ncbi:replication restart DNA helicase PriA [Halopseudomonas xinjiangensis]|uniref:Replication restart protein PriA n=1 Tax=Halopseudomonas xinjiangensis TaxID=487184 RepID=A0A1H1WX21_9GAMM|nr:replication restart DNA helicase PriA [Halopseudomonas xinjiangensis]